MIRVRTLALLALPLVLTAAASAQLRPMSRRPGDVYVSGYQDPLSRAVPLGGDRALRSMDFSANQFLPAAYQAPTGSRQPAEGLEASRLRRQGERALEQGDHALAVSSFARALSKTHRTQGAGTAESREISLLLAVSQRGLTQRVDPMLGTGVAE